jgi:hypothetical protein
VRRYKTDRCGVIASFDIAEALRRAEQRGLARERLRLEHAARVAERASLLERLRALVAMPRRSAV